MSTIGYAFRIIHQGYSKSILQGHDSFACQLTNNNKGFSDDAIAAIKKRLKPIIFNIPVHISILPFGKALSSEYLFDGLEEIYYNSADLKQVIKKLTRKKLK